jgi:hypothetical protein
MTVDRNNPSMTEDKVSEFKKGETVIHYAGTPHEKEIIYLSDFMFKRERWFNIQLSNGGFMETQFITKKS